MNKSCIHIWLILGLIISMPALSTDDVIVDFGSLGLWARMNDATWEKLSGASPDDVVIGDVNGNGKDDIIADFSTAFGAIYKKIDQGNWQKLLTSSSELMASGDLDNNGLDDVILDLGNQGLWARMNNATWKKLIGTSPDMLRVLDIDGNGEDDVVAYFSVFGGIYVKRNQGNWSVVIKRAPDSMSDGDLDDNGIDDLIVDFNSIGLWARMNDATWNKLNNSSSDNTASGDITAGSDDVIAGFGSTFGGLWQLLDLGSWTKINNNTPERMVTARMDSTDGDELVVDFGSALNGIYTRRNNSSWELLHGQNSELLAVGDLDNDEASSCSAIGFVTLGGTGTNELPSSVSPTFTPQSYSESNIGILSMVWTFTVGDTDYKLGVSDGLFVSFNVTVNTNGGSTTTGWVLNGTTGVTITPDSVVFDNVSNLIGGGGNSGGPTSLDFEGGLCRN